MVNCSCSVKNISGNFIKLLIVFEKEVHEIQKIFTHLGKQFLLFKNMFTICKKCLHISKKKLYH